MQLNTKATQKAKVRLSRLLQHLAWKQSGTILVEWEGMEKLVTAALSSVVYVSVGHIRELR